MAKKIKWTSRAIVDRTDIYQYWIERNLSNTYSEKLEGSNASFWLVFTGGVIGINEW